MAKFDKTLKLEKAELESMLSDLITKKYGALGNIDSLSFDLGTESFGYGTTENQVSVFKGVTVRFTSQVIDTNNTVSLRTMPTG